MKTKALILLALLAMLLGSTMACGGDGVQEAIPTLSPVTEYFTYKDTVNGFSISYPEDWREEPRGALVAFLAPSACGEEEAYFHVIKEDLPGPMTVEQYFAARERRLRETVEEYTIMDDEYFSVGGTEAIEIEMVWRRGGTLMKAMQLYLVVGSTAWVVTGTCAKACWSQYEPIFDTIVESFRLLD